MITFQTLGLTDDTTALLKARNIETPTPVQAAVIPAILRQEHTIFQSETGTGKTLAYVLPLLQMRDTTARTPVIIIAAPTHELASQIKMEVQNSSAAKAALCIGGTMMKRQIEMLKEKPEIIIGGPTRILELIHLKKLKITAVAALVLDEADRLLSKEMKNDTCELIRTIAQNKDRDGIVQIIACSATMNKTSTSMIESCLCEAGKEKPHITEIALPPEDILQRKITHWALFTEQRDKIDTLRKFLAAENPGKALVFTSRADQVELIVSRLAYKKVNCEGLHAKADKKDRKQAIDRFRSGKCTVLVTSDLAARGLDIPGITHIIQMDVPASPDFFIHRSGRTARAGASGINAVIGTEFELRQFAKLEKKLHITVYPKELHDGQVTDPIQ